jgi:hypothetical protein
MVISNAIFFVLNFGLQFSQAIRICHRLSAMARGEDDPGEAASCLL